MNCISVKTVNNKNFPHQLQKKRKRKNRGSKRQECKSTKGKTTDSVLALLKIQNKFILDEDKVTFPNDNTPKLLLVLFFNRQENEKVILKCTVKASQGTHSHSAHKIIGRNTTCSSKGIIILPRWPRIFSDFLMHT